LGIEVEIKLTALDPAVLDELVSYRELAGYALRPVSARTLRDRYWDTPSGDLAGRHVSLRLRLQDGDERFTLKWPASVDGALFRRRELELPASRENWSAVRAELAREGVRLPSAPSQAGTANDWLGAAGLQITQDRGTARRVLIAARDGQALVELALDSTVYHLDVYDIVFREIEAEALTDDAQHALALGAAIERAFPGRVRPSKVGKYSRGLELAARLAAPYGHGIGASVD
jgi:inorganic triphosphatase YgiF